MDSYIFLGLGANFSFALGTMIFTYFSKKISSAWMNCAKAFFALIFFGIYIIALEKFTSIAPFSFSLFFLSGFMGLGIGDIFLLKAFEVLGPGRTLMLFGFQPIFLGIMSKFLFNQDIALSKLISILFFIGCLLCISIESFKKDKSFGIQGMLIAFTGVILDSCGVLITRHAFNLNPGFSSTQANFYRCFGAVSFFVLFSFFKPIHFFGHLFKLSKKEKFLLVGGSFLGTFLSLSLYLKALQTAKLAILSGINITGTLFSTTFEVVFLKRKPTKYLFFAFLFFVGGMYFIYA